MPETSNQQSASSKRFWLCLSFVVFVILSISFAGYKHHVATSAEASALQFVRINGSTSEGYRHNFVSSLLSYLPFASNSKPMTAQATAGVSFPRDRMNDYMAKELLKIRNLKSILLYPPDPDRNGIDYQAKSFSQVLSLQGLNLPVSEQNIMALEQRFPGLLIQLVDYENLAEMQDSTK